MSGAAAPIAGRPNVAPNGTAGASLGDELRALDDARTALTAGNTARALALLDRHDHDFVPAALAPEAMALRIEAYAGSGRRDSVARLASRFLSLYGDRPEAQRVRSILQAQQVDPNP
jgi:outer membrane protein assembly factor BamD (BamD/ComL family)